ncbi:MAG: hypothetical protein JWN41_140 [Thermoleophilia bacterium]|nr:hypothetical protein [Thermoleophilia bacterium]
MLAGALLVLAAVASWIGAPISTGAITPVNNKLAVHLDVPVQMSVTPGLTAGDTSVRLPMLTLPGDPQDVTSGGWKLSTNWVNGYEVRIRSTSDPAMRGQNAVDGSAAQDSFADFSTANACPCAWSTENATKGTFGYSAAISGGDGTLANAAQWGAPGARKWRGLDRASYQLFATTGGTNQYPFSLLFRSQIPMTATQTAGSYRASFIVAVAPQL